MKYTIKQAKATFSKLLREAAVGTEVIIVQKGEPVARLVALKPVPRPRVLGKFAGKISASPSAFDELTESELRLLGFN